MMFYFYIENSTFAHIFLGFYFLEKVLHRLTGKIFSED